MTELTFYCTVCGMEWSEYYDAVAHAYHSHELCGMPASDCVEWR